MTFKHRCEQSDQSVTGVVDVNVNLLHVFSFLTRVQSAMSHTNKTYVQYNSITCTDSDYVKCWMYGTTIQKYL